MPIYEYECESCGHQLEALQKMSDAPLTECPACGRPALKKLLSAAAFRLKGSGWYETDFKSGNKKNLADSGSADKEGGKGGDKKKENKTAAKADTSNKSAGAPAASTG